jgi:uncharacterized protein (TIGR03067 family)
MTLLLITIALAIPTFAQETRQLPRQNKDEKLPMHKLDGEWTVAYAEMDGKKMEGKGFTQVTIKNNVVTCRHDGKEKSWRLEFGPHNMVRCTEQIDGKTTIDATQEKRDPADKSQHTHHGVYIASQDYFCLCLNKGRDRRTFAPTERRENEERSAQPGTTPRFGEQGAHGAHFVIILHRSSAAPAPNSR